MSGGGGGGARGAAGPVPASARKLVQGLKEIVNRPDAEIYAALRECGMDPDEAVSRLLSQDTFQEVKSKRDKKKEVKETPEPRSRGASNSNSRTIRGGADRTGRGSSVQSGSSGADYMTSRSSILGPSARATNSTQKQSVPSFSANKDVVPNGSVGSPQSSSGFQHNWCGVPGQMSMADIVKMGRPQVRSSSKPVAATDASFAGQSQSLSSSFNQSSKQSASTDLPTTFDQGFPALQDPIPQNVNSSHASAENHQTHENDWFPQDEPAPETQSTSIETSGDPSLSVASLDSSMLVADASNSRENSHAEENSSTVVKSAILSERNLEILEENNQFNDELLQNSSTYQPEVHSYVDDEVEFSNVDVESAAAKFQHLSVQNEDIAATESAEDIPAVILPDHLQVASVDCAHLSFGSFESGAFSGLLSSNVPKNGLEEVPIADESPSVNQIDARNQDYYDNGALNSSANEDVETRVGTNMENIDVPSVSEPDVLRQGALDVPGLQYNLPSVSSHPYSNTTQPSAMDDPQGNTQAQNLSHFSSILQANTLPNSLLGSNLTPLRDFDFSQLLQTQSATKYNPSVATNNLPAISLQETLQGGFPNTQSTQNLPSTSIPSGLPLPQQLPVHPYSQPTLPLGPFASLVGYPYLPQNYYLPSAAFQQAYSSNGPFHQSAAPAVPGAGMKYSMPQYKSSPPASSLHQPSSLSGYGGFGSAGNIPGNFSINQGASAPTTMGFDEALGTQFKDPNHYVALQQSDNSAMWLHGAAGSRAVSAVPPGNFYGFQGQSQQGGFRQTQQPSQYGGLGYPSFYQSQAGLPQEHPQNPTEGSLNNPQTAPTQPSHQLWQHSY
ncbi:actin cytoskeleton-regulatory complex protein PAN1-like [Phragmites australis]|uniref:actin cytoskeleton-regulatory complex protein PAN1-like n=1 Tax=Phragmites australis TaxID=29695 RepID=UPI002D7A1695|nr:actin cytoskeleton-regulatory complex protein PAN1-like [Phragmites australis]